MWVSFAPQFRLIIDFTIGPRKQYVANRLVELTDKCLSGLKPLFVSDGLRFYSEALLQKYGKWVGFPRTGKRGRPKSPKLETRKQTCTYCSKINTLQQWSSKYATS
ncbi:MAG: hypothetical protein RBT65_11495 [Methanolobus sp.]|nr:hypothetical protein [Methanolobus sp.]